MLEGRLHQIYFIFKISKYDIEIQNYGKSIKLNIIIAYFACFY